ncbi:hypothetical protein TH47_17235 [Thalassospira sp. MCCC 1A02803]|nr:hypothetical protein TH47_17235 [Thalassospira sp. MCCC 1A02803]
MTGVITFLFLNSGKIHIPDQLVKLQRTAGKPRSIKRFTDPVNAAKARTVVF